MNVNRRGFVKLAGAAGVAAVVGDASRAAASTSGAAAPARRADDGVAMLVDTTRCVGCRACEAACSEANGLPAPAMAGEEKVFATTRSTGTKAYTVVNRFAGPDGGAASRFVKKQCMHCVDPACATACPVKALEKTAAGPVVYNGDRCIGCRYCMVACPFGVPKYEFEKAAPYVKKCSFCVARLAKGERPACASVCPSGALEFGKRKGLLEVAKSRIYRDPERYEHHVYGEHEVGGTNWLYLSDVPFERLGFRTDLPTTAYADLTTGALAIVPLLLMLWPPFLMGLQTFARRREEHVDAGERRAEGGEPS
jgi:formate dehydrogenase iron-sulfur subunit